MSCLKFDLIESYGKLGECEVSTLLQASKCQYSWSIIILSGCVVAFNLDFYTDVQDLSYLQHHLDQDF